MGFLRWLFGTGDFMAHGYCFMWNRALLRLHLFSDLWTGLAYVAFAVTITYLVSKARRDIPFHWMFLTVGGVFVLCGGTHLMDVWTLFTPVYWLSGCIRAVTAVVSVAAAVALPPLVPRVLEMVRDAKLAEAQRKELEKEVDERSRAEAEIRRLNEELERRVEERTSQLSQANFRLLEKAAIVQHSRDAIVSKTLDGVITSWNPAAEKIYGYSSGEAIGRNFAMLVPPDRLNEFTDILNRIRSGEEVPPLDTVRVRRDGRLIQVSTTVSPVADDAGTIRGASVIARDITEYRNLEQQLLQAQKMEAVGRLAGGVAHDFNNLLTAILGFSGLVLERLGPGDPIRDALVQISESGERAAALTRQLLAFSRKQVLQPQVVDLNALVDGVKRMLGRLIGEDVELVTVLDPSLRPVKIDPGQYQQVIVNLAVNARDAMPKGGRLSIETANVELDAAYTQKRIGVQPGPYVMTAVSDTGIGMDAATQSQIFEPFFTTKPAGKGTGLGLSTVYGIVKQSGGEIWVYSEPGKGTTFKIYLPPTGVVVEQVESELEPEAPGTGTVLVVEDEGTVRALIRESLEGAGYEVLEAANADAALQVSQNYAGTIDLMITDVIMPGPSGRELAKSLEPLRPGMAVLYISGYTDAIIEHGVLGKGLAFLQKPFTPLALVRKVKTVLARRLRE